MGHCIGLYLKQKYRVKSLILKAAYAGNFEYSFSYFFLFSSPFYRVLSTLSVEPIFVFYTQNQFYVTILPGILNIPKTRFLPYNIQSVPQIHSRVSSFCLECVFKAGPGQLQHLVSKGAVIESAKKQTSTTLQPGATMRYLRLGIILITIGIATVCEYHQNHCD